MHAIGLYEGRHCEKMHIEMVWAHKKIKRICKDDPTGHGTRREKERETEKDNIPEWTGLELGEAFQKAEDREEWRKVVGRSSLMRQWSFRPRDK